MERLHQLELDSSAELKRLSLELADLHVAHDDASTQLELMREQHMTVSERHALCSAALTQVRRPRPRITLNSPS